MKKNLWDKALVVGVVLILIFSFVYFILGRKNLRERAYLEPYANAEATGFTPNFNEGQTVKQIFINHADIARGVTLRIGTYGLTLDKGSFYVTLSKHDGDVLVNASISGEDIVDNEATYIEFPEQVTLDRNAQYDLILTSSLEDQDGNTPTVWYGEKKEDTELFINGDEVDNTLFFRLDSYRYGFFYKKFSITLAVILGAYFIFCRYQKRCEQKEKKTIFSEIVHIFDNYNFLLGELIGRDFSVKYRRSYLGFLWIILNPLLTMVVMSAVFSYMFRFNIENFPVYLIIGNVVFNFFSESTQMACGSIVGSGQLIKKVYIPKYIFPLSKVMFSFFNFVLSLIPVFCVILFYRMPIDFNVLLLPVLLTGLFLFSLGVGMFLSAYQVYFRDVQYLYGILLVLWTYLTPIFYPVDSLSPHLQTIIRLNPMYVYVNGIREVLMYMTTPSVMEMVSALAIGVVSLTIGLFCFNTVQDNFILAI